MYKLVKFATSIVLLIAVFATVPANAQNASNRFPGIGRDATPAEVEAWDIDVRPDLKGFQKDLAQPK